MAYIKSQLLFCILSASIASSWAGQFRVPVKRTILSQPTTPIQKMLAESRSSEESKEWFKKNAPHLLQASQSTIDLLNSDNLSYTGPAYFGSPMQEPTTSEFIYDTGSGYLTVTGYNCTTCTLGYRYYDPKNSTTATGEIDSNKTLSYGSATLNGFMMRDNVCLDYSDLDTCNNDFEFFYIESETGLDYLDGILGLCPDVVGNGPSYMKALIDADQLDEPVASFKLQFDTQKSEVLLGGIDSNDYIGDIIYNDIALNSWWTVNLKGIMMGDTNIYSSGTQYAIIDTGTSLLTISHSDYTNFVSQIQSIDSSIQCDSTYCYSDSTQCSSFYGVLPDLVIQLGNNNYTIPVEGYTMEGGIFGNECIFAVSSIPDRDNLYILGDTFIRNYYSIFNYSKLQVGLAVSADAPSGVSISGDITSPTNSSGSSLNSLQITAIVLLSLLILLILIFVILTCRNRRRQRQINKAKAETNIYQAQTEPLASRPLDNNISTY